MTEFQALITGAISGALMKASAEGPFLIDSEVETDAEGNYTNRILVTGRETGEELVVTVEPFYDTPETVERKMQGVHAMREAAERHGIELA
jgi:hypothetical protein